MFVFKRNICIIISEWKYFATVGMLYNVLLPINCYIGNSTTECHSRSCRVIIESLLGYFIRLFLQSLRSLHHPFSIASDLLDISNPHEYADIFTK